MGTFCRSRHELIFAFKKGTAPHVNTFELGQHGRYRTNAWQYRGVNTMRAGRMKPPALHQERMNGIILDEAYRTITVRDGDRNLSAPIAQAIIRSLAVNAARGQHRAQRLFAELLSCTENDSRALHNG